MLLLTTIPILYQDPLDQLSLYLQATQEACLWDTTARSSPVPSPHTSYQLVSILFSTSLANIICQISLFQSHGCQALLLCRTVLLVWNT